MAGPSLSTQSIKLLDSVTIYTNSVLQLYEIYYKIGDDPFVEIARGVYKSCTWTPPAELLGKVTSDGAICTIRCQRNILVYTDLTITLYPPDNAIPVVSDGWFTAAADNSGGAASQISGEFVKSYSKARITFDPSKISTKYGATVRSLSVIYNGVKNTAVSNVATTDILVDSESELILSVTDTNGVRKEVRHTLTTKSYFPPTITDISVFRSDSLGSPDDTGRYIAVRATAKCTNLNGNIANLYAQYKPNGGSYTQKRIVPSGIMTVINQTEISQTQSYFVLLTVEDKISSATYQASILTTGVTVHLRDGGKAVGVGKYAEQDDVFECAWNADFKGDISAVGKLSAASLTTAGSAAVGSLTIGGVPVGQIILNAIYPIGATYMSLENTNPGTFLGGTWQALANRYILSGTSTAEYTLTEEQMPVHDHLFDGYTDDDDHVYGYTDLAGGKRVGLRHITQPFSVGLNTSTLYSWKRTA